MAKRSFILMVLWVIAWLSIEVFVGYVLGPKFLFWQREQFYAVSKYAIHSSLISSIAVILFFSYTQNPFINT